MQSIKWPEGKDFAFTVFDDTDLGTIDNLKPVYELLNECRIYTTKSVWPVKGPKKPIIGGSTCEDPEYLKWLYELKKQGFEIGYHNTTYHTSTRDETMRGLEQFREFFGQYPSSMANHADCGESIYWGNYRLSGLNEFVYNLLLRFRHKGIFRGHLEDDQHFWGDYCRDNIKYVRNFVYGDINTLKMCPVMPYHDPDRPYVNQWFASSEGPTVTEYNRCISEKNQDRLLAEGGACIMYSHFACDFVRDGELDPEFERLTRRLSCMNGWFVPVSTLLDYINFQRGEYQISKKERSKLERLWLAHKIRIGGSS
jgi:hypothetical protein